MKAHCWQCLDLIEVAVTRRPNDPDAVTVFKPCGHTARRSELRVRESPDGSISVAGPEPLPTSEGGV